MSRAISRLFTGACSVRHEVARVFIKDDLVFCHQDRTGTCVGGNSGVRSSRDNVASVRRTGSGTARGSCDCQPRKAVGS